MRRRVNVNEDNWDGQTALDVAVMSGRKEAERYLRDHDGVRHKEELSVVVSSLSFM